MPDMLDIQKSSYAEFLQMDLLPLASVKETLLIGMTEVLLEMFLLDAGSFHFTDTPVEDDGAGTRLDARMLAITIAAQSDDYRDFIAGIGSLECEITAANPNDPPAQSAEERLVRRLAASCRTLRQVFEKTPLAAERCWPSSRSRSIKGALK